MSNIHPTAHVAPEVELGAGVTVGPFAVIEGPGVIGEGCRIEAHAVIRPYVRMGRHNHVHPHAVLGGLPQDLGFDEATETYLDIGDHNVFREAVTLSRATQPGGSTRLGSHNYLMNGSHVGHDCVLGDRNIFASNVALGGHVQMGDRVFCGGGAVVHQFCRVGSLAILQGLAGINKDVIPYTMVGGRPGKHYRVNLVGVRRAGIDGDRLKAVSAAFRRLRNKQSLDDLPDTPELAYLRQWLAAESKRHGNLGFVELGRGDD
ncbi:acyl-[acyl-carrier-protein]--UDP-N-acetylglucosamine O-acyltransferase [Methylomagnum ishizawai]|uniref:Acyl-[acyl-carrier-protein]--UDP-N-acetylglucosamine O-acyltransferase n=1 Tax=Methylomagnum ishizawai TaxID=1760988 RepID=A0A1Y6D089_9GAMM|nr:acyl-ACP--UDP-N-acetylglucosamine O-acyltransferase [Methylomagnum ishizawai]SMF95986.1 acyl-[acyl-carrier-protein]--UDP-N-acetylglucosamine O-acyltransferase [Methylomagnum ishizawai]